QEVASTSDDVDDKTQCSQLQISAKKKVDLDEEEEEDIADASKDNGGHVHVAGGVPVQPLQ
ncbi:unnamed protein product, partial [Amoebophrya sp. A25]